MKKRTIGWIAVILGGLVLSIQMYMLYFFHMFAFSSAGVQMGGILKENALEFLSEPVICFALIITVSIIIIGVFLIIKDSKSKD
jgi:hypothetical protein